eukprot:Gb_11824 [translate_table: standard]
MGNHLACIAVNPVNNMTTIKLVYGDGRIRIMQDPLVAGEVMLEHPHYFVCHADSFYIGQRIPALCAHDELKMGHTYILLPKKAFGSVLSASSLASLAASKTASPIHTSLELGRPASSVIKRSPPRILSQAPFEIRKTVDGRVQVKVSVEFIAKILEDGSLPQSETSHNRFSLCNTPELQKDYGQLVKCRSQHWRPKLDTIREIEKGNKRFRFYFQMKHPEIRNHNYIGFGILDEICKEFKYLQQHLGVYSAGTSTQLSRQALFTRLKVSPSRLIFESKT